MKTFFLFILLTLPVLALPDKPEKGVVYTEEFSPQSISLKVEKAGWVYATKKGGRKRGALKIGSTVDLVSFTEQAYFVRGKKEDGVGVSGWVTPAAFSAKDPEFVEKLKQVHARQLVVRELIEKGEIALGMTFVIPTPVPTFGNSPTPPKRKSQKPSSSLRMAASPPSKSARTTDRGNPPSYPPPSSSFGKSNSSPQSHSYHFLAALYEVQLHKGHFFKL